MEPESSSYGEYHIIDNTFEGNEAYTNDGAAIYLGRARGEITHNLFLNNWAASDGGAVYVNPYYGYPRVLTIRQNFFGGNFARDRGGALRLDDGGEAIWVENNIFVDNETYGVGGAIYGWGDYTNRTVRIANNTIVGNVAGVGGGLYLYDWPYEVTGNIIAFNVGGGMYCDLYTMDEPYLPQVSYTDVHGNSGGDWLGFCADETGTNGNIDANPTFVDFNDDLDPTDDNLHLAGGSVCIDAGAPAPRYDDVNGTRNDMGAYGGPYGVWVTYGM